MSDSILPSTCGKISNLSQVNSLYLNGSQADITLRNVQTTKSTDQFSISSSPYAKSQTYRIDPLFNPLSFGSNYPTTSLFSSAPSTSETQLEESVHQKNTVPRTAVKRKRSGDGLMFIAIIHILLACGLIDVGIFMSVRFSHIIRIWPDSYAKLTISDIGWFENQASSNYY
ncbi:unnamed protein product [Thelazia callipaeda]|uniref:Uncharacterized protein n=1 Tax=Thelazia callipaeda TaxID=103827 RepID=A0A0N5D937_THECL|nr:unnamed protein product [Thelazia callipaeda]